SRARSTTGPAATTRSGRSATSMTRTTSPSTGGRRARKVVAMRCFEVEVEAKVAQVRLCRPDELNTMVPEFWRELPELIQRLSDDGGVRAVVLSSTGKHFSAGMDLSVFTGGQGESGE